MFFIEDNLFFKDRLDYKLQLVDDLLLLPHQHLLDLFAFVLVQHNMPVPDILCAIL